MSFDKNLTLEAKNREQFGKNATRRLRAEGLIPITVYGGGKESASSTIGRREFAALLRKYGRAKIFTLNNEGSATPVKIAELQLDPIKGGIVHADFIRISLTELTNFDVPVKLIGEPDGVKTFGGILDFVKHNVEIRCLPTELPDALEVEISGLGIGEHVSVKDLKVGQGIEILDDPETVIATVSAPRIEVEAAPELEAAAEPEVIKKGKAEEGQE